MEYIEMGDRNFIFEVEETKEYPPEIYGILLIKKNISEGKYTMRQTNEKTTLFMLKAKEKVDG